MKTRLECNQRKKLFVRVHRQKREIEQGHWADPTDAEEARAGGEVEFDIEAPSYIKPGTMKLVRAETATSEPQQQRQRKKGTPSEARAASPVQFSTTSQPGRAESKKCPATQWECPYCGYRENSLEWDKTTCQGPWCNKDRPKNEGDVGRWVDKRVGDEVVKVYMQYPWRCRSCHKSSKNSWMLDEHCKSCGAERGGEASRWKFSPGERLWYYFDPPPLEVPAPNEHHSVEEICRIADSGYEADAEQKLCVCCERPRHSNGKSVRFSQYYSLKDDQSYRATYRRAELQKVLNASPRCECLYRGARESLLAIPRSGRTDTVFRVGGDATPQARGQYERKRSTIRERATNHSSIGRQFEVITGVAETQGCHVIPLQAGGCPMTGLAEKPPFNIVPITAMCPLCQKLDKLFTEWQSEDTEEHAGRREFNEASYMERHPMKSSELEAPPPPAQTTTESRAARIYPPDPAPESDALPRRPSLPPPPSGKWPVPPSPQRRDTTADTKRSSRPPPSSQRRDTTADTKRSSRPPRAAARMIRCAVCSRAVELPVGYCEREKECPHT